MSTLYVCEIEDGVCRTFTKESVLRDWLENKRRNCESPEEFSKWLEDYFENGNEISVHGEQYTFWDCLELI